MMEETYTIHVPIVAENDEEAQKKADLISGLLSKIIITPEKYIVYNSKDEIITPGVVL